MIGTIELQNLPIAHEVDVADSLLVMRSNGLARIHKNAVFVKRNPVKDFNECVATGYYPINRNYSPLLNAPKNTSFGVLLVFDDNAIEDQEFVQLVISILPTGFMFVRKKGSGSGWGEWKEVVTSSVGGG